jgi:hypothetical protein
VPKENKMSILGKLFASGLENMDEVNVRPSRKFTAKDIHRIAERGASEFRANALNLLSCYELEGEFGLYSTLGNFIQTKNAMTAEIAEAVADGDEIALVDAFRRAMENAFTNLVQKGALKRLQLVENWPAEADAEYERMRRSASATLATNAVPVAAKAPVAPVVRETPVETCAREFRELPSNAWKSKWLNDQRNRPIADQAVAEGRI